MAIQVGDVGIHNGSYLGIDTAVREADFLIFPIPWDVTTSYRPGTVNGPEAVIEASYQLDLYSPFLANFDKVKVGTVPVSEKWKARSQELRAKTSNYIAALANGESPDTVEMLAILEEANGAALELQAWSRTKVAAELAQGKTVLTLGGDHSVPLGAIEAYAAKYPGLSILHFDAHADLREAYEGFTQSHASIMNNVLNLPGFGRLIQVGIRDVSKFEVDLIARDSRISTFFDWDLKAALDSGRTWSALCDDIVAKLGPEVYISFDIDGLDPKLCPSTGTPVPGGLELAQATALIQAVVRSGRRVVGADLVEVTPGANGDQWDGNVGARVLFQLLVACAGSRTR